MFVVRLMKQMVINMHIFLAPKANKDLLESDSVAQSMCLGEILH